jgi:hypothetical protein
MTFAAFAKMLLHSDADAVAWSSFTMYIYCTNAVSDNPTYLAGRERICEGMRLAGVPEG